MNILFLSRWFPYPPDNGSRIRVFNLIKQLAGHHTVDLVSFASETVSEKQLTAMGRYCRQVKVARYRPFQPTRWKAVLGFASRRPRAVVDTYNIEMERCVRQLSAEYSYEAVVASQTDMAPYAMLLPPTPKILEEIELTTFYDQFTRSQQPLKKLRYGLTWWKLSHYMASLLHTFDGCTVVSQAERDHILKILPGYSPIEVIANGVDTAHYKYNSDLPAPDTLVYSGALTYQANFDAVKFFLRDIFPLIRAQQPQVNLAITGKTEGVPLDQLPLNGNVTLTGYLEDIRPTVAGSWLNIVPLRIGGGSRLKILESLALGTPVVATGKGAEGLDLVPGRDLLIADEPADFAEAVLRILQDGTLREDLSRHGRQAVAARYDWSMIGQRFNRFIEKVVLESKTKKVEAHG